MKSFLKIIIAFNLLPVICCGQQIVWQNHYGGMGYEYIPEGWPLNADILMNETGEYIFTAVTSSFDVNQNHYAVKVNHTGNLVWELNAGSNVEVDIALCSIKSHDGNYFMAGVANMQSINANDIRLTKFTDDGDILFSKIILTDSLYPAIAHDICYTADSNYIAACATYHNISLVKLNNNGDTLWVTRPLPDSLGSGVPLCFQPAPDFSAYYGVSRHNNYDYYWFKTDASGNLLNFKRIENPGQYWLQVKKAVMLPNGNILAYGGGSSPAGSELCPNHVIFYDFLFEYNPEGEVIREKILCTPQFDGDPPYTRSFDEFMVADDGSIYFTVINRLYKLNSDWDFEWAFNVSIQGAELMKLAQFEYGYLIAAGQLQLDSDDIDIFMCKIALPEAMGVEDNKENNFILYPNPASNNLIIQTAEKGKAEYFIYDVSGRLLHSGSFVQSKTIDVNSLAEGVYLLRVETEDGALSRKFIKQNE